MTNIKPIKILELFGGVGAPRKALINLGINHKSIDYVEIDEKAVKTYNSLFYKYNKAKVQSVVGWNLKPDILVHGSPCQDFSIAGRQQGANKGSETRSSLMWETLRIIENMGVWKPRVVIWENVKNVLSKYMVHNFNKYLEKMEEMGYINSYGVLNALEFGIPQNRNRLFVISILAPVKVDFSSFKRKPLRDIKEFLEKEVDDKYIINAPSMLNKINKEGKESFQGRLQIIEKYAWTITTKQDRCPNAGIIQLENGKYRVLTEKECWRLMGFTDEDYKNALAVHPGKIGCKNGVLYKQAGNSIVVQVLEGIFEKLIEEKIIGE